MNAERTSTYAATGIDESTAGDGNENVGPLDRILSTIERREIVTALSRAKGQRTLAAKMLGISRSRLYRRMEALGVDPNSVKDFGGPRGQ